MIIYKATNILNGKVYIGQTTHSLEKRKAQHFAKARKGIQTHFYNAIRKYGEDSFIFEVICVAGDKVTLNELETYYINKYDSIHNGYNMIDGGNNNVMFLPEVKDRHAKRLHSAETRKNISIGMKKYRAEHPFTDEHRKKLSEAAKGNHNFGSSDTRSIGCYCKLSNGEELHFHSYRDAWQWWKEQDTPFNTNTECVFQRKIKQSIECGYYTYGRSTIKYEYPKWFREEVLPNEKVTDKN